MPKAVRIRVVSKTRWLSVPDGTARRMIDAGRYFTDAKPPVLFGYGLRAVRVPVLNIWR